MTLHISKYNNKMFHVYSNEIYFCSILTGCHSHQVEMVWIILSPCHVGVGDDIAIDMLFGEERHISSTESRATCQHETMGHKKNKRTLENINSVRCVNKRLPDSIVAGEVMLGTLASGERFCMEWFSVMKERMVMKEIHLTSSKSQPSKEPPCHLNAWPTVIYMLAHVRVLCSTTLIHQWIKTRAKIIKIDDNSRLFIVSIE